jgi:UDP-2,4-diacetamido-2,4,6-trideoxy-beta-L-altropyranose hydrolase
VTEASRGDVVFRADASSNIGLGHQMRCLTLARALRERGMACRFVAASVAGAVHDLVREAGFELAIVPGPSGDGLENVAVGSAEYYARVRGAWQADAAATRAMLGRRPTWLVVDNYALGAEWERDLAGSCERILAIDDLADRRHDCEALLDQGIGRTAADYQGLVPARCVVMAGSRHALLRPEFARARERRRGDRWPPARVLVSMGGTDAANATSAILAALQGCPLPADCEIIVAMGAQAPWLREVASKAAAMPWACHVRVWVEEMAQLMSECDLVIGAAGSSALERCALGVPSLTVVTADNQASAARQLSARGAATVVALAELGEGLPKAFESLSDTRPRAAMSASAMSLVDGLGATRVADFLAGGATP